MEAPKPTKPHASLTCHSCFLHLQTNLPTSSRKGRQITHTMPSTPFQTTTTDHDDSCGGATTISGVHPDIIEAHILTRLDGPSLASTATTCSQLHSLASNDHIWDNICTSTWPSTTSPRVRHLISTFPRASFSFFADSFPSVTAAKTIPNSRANPDRTPELISAVDLFHGENLILSKVVETETESGWFRCSPFRVDILDPKDAVRTHIKYPNGEDACLVFGEGLRLSWIVIDPKGRRAVNVSSRVPVKVHRHWLSGEVRATFATAVGGGERGTAACEVTVTCGGEDGGAVHVREVSLQMEDLDGSHLNGRESLGILQRALEGKRGNWGWKEGYVAFLERKKERKESKVRAERRLDMLCVALAALSFVVVSFSIFFF